MAGLTKPPTKQSKPIYTNLINLNKMATNWAYNYLTSKKTPCGKTKEKRKQVGFNGLQPRT